MLLDESCARRFDLHMHSTRSDGRYPLDEVVRRCVEAGLDVVAITDHDLATPLEPGSHFVGGRRIQIIAGSEISGTHCGREFHLLVYFPGEVPTGFVDLCRQLAVARAERYQVAIDKLGLSGLDSPDEAARSGERSVTRHHLARALVDAGHATSIRDAFHRHASRRNVPPISFSFLDAIRVARSFGGVTSWAHPPKGDVEMHLETFVAAGLQGLEALRPGLPSKVKSYYRKVARRHGLFLTAGSDWHGWTGVDLGLFFAHRTDLMGFISALRYAA